MKIFLSASMLGGTAIAAQAEPNVVVSIKPVHSLVASVMQGVGTPELIVEGAASPHTYALKPSQAANLEQADLVFWVGPGLEAFLEKPVGTIAAGAKSVELADTPGLIKIDFREGGAFEGHDHDHHAGHDHDDHDHAKAEAHDDHDHDDHDHAKAEAHDDHDHDDHDHAKAEAHDDHDHDDHDHAKAKAHDDHDHGDHDKDHAHAEEAGHDDHAHGSFDPHIWLDPENAKVLVVEIEAALSAADPDNAAKYSENAAALSAQLDGLTTEISQILEPVQGKGFIVFHDAYRYFENRFGVAAAGSITVSPEVLPGAERLREIQAKIGELGTTCVFSEPQFEPRLVATVTEGTEAASGVLDPLGANLEDGPELYPTLLHNMATSMRDCLSEGS
ncbi:zinc ABC transporter substrate-binding protein [Hoeflea prorocentri]